MTATNADVVVLSYRFDEDHDGVVNSTQVGKIMRAIGQLVRRGQIFSSGGQVNRSGGGINS
jgi:hypothetical protein